MTDADKVMNPQHFGSDGADVRIRIRTSAGNPDSNPGSLSVDILALADFGLSEHILFVCLFVCLFVNSITPEPFEIS